MARNRFESYGQKHVPPSHEAVRDAMPAFFDFLGEKTEPSVRVVFEHFVFMYIHSSIDGNSRLARFLMNVMLAEGDYPWIVVPLAERDAFLVALEEGSVRQDIVPCTNFLAYLVDGD